MADKPRLIAKGMATPTPQQTAEDKVKLVQMVRRVGLLIPKSIGKGMGTPKPYIPDTKQREALRMRLGSAPTN